MNSELRHRTYNTTMRDWIDHVPKELDDIGVGLAELLDDGKYGFGLDGAALVDFIRRSLHALLDKGAKPRHWGSPSHPDRNVMLHYGNDTNDEIVEGVIADWLASGGGDLEWGDFWFALPGTIDD